MGIATPELSSVGSFSKKNCNHHYLSWSRVPLIADNFSSSSSSSFSSSMSQDYHQAGLFSFSSNGFEISSSTSSSSQVLIHQHHLAQQIASRDKLRGYEPSLPTGQGPLVAIQQAGEESGSLPVYETAGMLSEMFNFPPPTGPAAPFELLDRPLQPNYHQHHHQVSGINADSAAAMQLFLMNPQPKSPSPAQVPATSSSSIHMLLPNPSPSLQGFTVSQDNNFSATTTDHISHPQFTLSNPTEIGSVIEGQGLSLSLSSSLQNLEAVKPEELRMGEGGVLYYGHHQTGSNSSSSGLSPYYRNLSGPQHQTALQLQPGGGPGENHHQLHAGYGSSLGMVNVLRNSKYVKAAQELLEEFCSIGRGQFKKNKFSKHSTNPSTNTPGGNSSGGGGGSSSSTKDVPPLAAGDRIEHQRKKVKLLSMLDEVDRRYNHYCEQMQMVVNSFDLVMGFGAAVPYTALAQRAMSRHFRCLKDSIVAQLRHSCEVLGEKDGATTSSSGITKGETPRLKLLELSLRQQRAFHQLGMMEQEAWRPQRGLPERSVNILRAWLFEHFLHPYPSDADKHLLARQTGLSRNQVSNWFINARVRLWKPMVEEMYQQESKDGEEEEEEEEEEEDSDKDSQRKQSNNNTNNNDGGQFSQTSTPPAAAATATAPLPPAASSPSTLTKPPTSSLSASKRSQIANDNDPSKLLAMNRQCFSENQATTTSTSTTNIMPVVVAPPPPHVLHHHHHQPFHDLADDTCRLGSIVTGDYGTTTTGISAGADHIGTSTLIRFGTTAATGGDVSLTLGLRHAGNMPEKAAPTSAFSVREFGNC